MRHYEFIVEYNTQATVKAMGSKIIDALKLPSVLGSLKQAVHNAHNMDSMKSEPYYIFYRGNDYGAETHYTFKKPTKFFNAINMTHSRPGLMEFQSLAALKLISYVHEFAVKKMKQDPRDSGWKNTVEHAWKEGSKKLEKEIITDVIDILESFDPTQNKQYTLQLVNWFINGRNFPKIEDGESTLRQSLYDFQKLKARIPEEYRDIRRYSNPKEFVDNVQTLKEKYGKEETMPKGKSQIIYQSENAIVRWPEDQDAACYLGQGTQWCTATTQAENFFDDYDNEGPLAIINFAKPFTIFDMQYGGSAEFGGDEGPGEEKRIHKIQIHFTNEDSSYGNDEEYYHPGYWAPTQIADAQDKPLDFNDLYDSTVGGKPSPFRQMWNDPKFQTAITKMWEQWQETRY